MRTERKTQYLPTRLPSWTLETLFIQEVLFLWPLGSLLFIWCPLGPLQGQVLLGTVGAFNWSGGALLYNTQNGRGRFLNQTAKEDFRAAQYSYLGKGGVWWMQAGRGWGLKVAKRKRLWDSKKVGRGPGLDGENGAWSARNPSKWIYEDRA